MNVRLWMDGSDGKGGWIPLAYQTPAQPPGSISDVSTGQRQIYVTFCLTDRGAIYRSANGVDHLTGSGSGRVLNTEALILVKELRPGECYEMSIQPEPFPHKKLIRYRCEAVKPS